MIEGAERILRQLRETTQEGADYMALQNKFEALKRDYVKLRNQSKIQRDILGAIIDVIGEALQRGHIRRDDFE